MSGPLVNSLINIIKARRLKATVVEYANHQATVRVASGARLSNVRVVGGSLTPGQNVLVEWDGYAPIIQATSSTEYSSSTTSTVYQPGASGMDDLFTRAGWTISEQGIIHTAETFIYPEGKIQLGGSPPNIAIMEGNQVGGYAFWAGHADPGSAPFSIKRDGTLYATSATLTGSVTATSGAIGGWNISATALTSGSTEINSSVPCIRMNASNWTTGSGIWMGLNSGAYKLRIGDLTGGQLVWDGSALTLAGWTINATAISSDSGGIGMASSGTWRFWAGNTTPASAPFRVDNLGNTYLTSATITGSVQSSTFTSGIAGWSINVNGDAEFGNVVVRGELRSSVFVANLIEARAGTSLWGKSAAVLAADMIVLASGDWSMFIKDAPGTDQLLFSTGDICRVKSEYAGGIADIWFTVSNGVTQNNGTQRYTCTYASGTRSITYPEGAPVVDYGTSGQGLISVSADGGIGPIANISLFTHAGSPWTSQTLLTRIGNLNGTHGYATNVYGIALGEYGSGKANLTWDPTNGLRLRNYSTTVIQLANDGSANFQGVLGIGVNGGIYQGSGSFASPTTGLKIYNNTTSGVLETWSSSAWGIRINNQGISLNASDSFGAIPRRIDFYNSSGQNFGSMEPVATTSLPVSGLWNVEARTLSLNEHSLCLIRTNARPSYQAAVQLLGLTQSTPETWTNLIVNSVTGVMIQGSGGDGSRRFHIGIPIQHALGNPLEIHDPIYAMTDIRSNGGLYVGSIATDPASGDITATGTIRANTAFNRSGTVGHIFMPLITPADLTDSVGNVWNGGLGSSATPLATGTYSFLDTTSGNPWPSTARAVVVLIQAAWNTAATANYIAGKAYNGTVNAGVMRATVTTISLNDQWVIPLSTGADFQLVISGLGAFNLLCRCVGYFM